LKKYWLDGKEPLSAMTPFSPFSAVFSPQRTRESRGKLLASFEPILKAIES
jgi:hypothetical protein